MAKGPKYRVAFRRRREGKTNYYRRKQMLMSDQPRAIIRGSLNHMTIQLADAKIKGDEILASAHTSELLQLGWKYHTGNLPSAYLTGFLAGTRALKSKKKIKSAIADFGVLSRPPRARLYAAIKGLIDAGISINCDEKMLPSEQRIKGSHIAEFAEKLHADNEEQYKRQFSATLKRRANPLKITEKVDLVKNAIQQSQDQTSVEVTKPKKTASSTAWMAS